MEGEEQLLCFLLGSRGLDDIAMKKSYNIEVNVILSSLCIPSLGRSTHVLTKIALDS